MFLFSPVLEATNSRNRGGCGVLEVFERGIRLERLGEMLGTFRTDAIAVETAKEGRNGVLAAADSRFRAYGGVLERLQRGIGLEALREVFGGLSVEIVISEAASRGKTRVLAAADSREQGVGRRT